MIGITFFDLRMVLIILRLEVMWFFSMPHSRYLPVKDIFANGSDNRITEKHPSPIIPFPHIVREGDGDGNKVKN